MLCQKCGLAEATIHKEEVVYRQKIEQHLCALCGGVGQWDPPREVLLGSVHGFSVPSGLAAPGRPKKPLEEATAVLADLSRYVMGLYAGGTGPRMLAVSDTERFRIHLLHPAGSQGTLLMIAVFGQDKESAELERQVRDYFRHKQVPVSEGAGEPGLRYELPGTSYVILRFLLGLLTDCFEVQADDLLKVSLINVRPNPEK